MLHRTFRFELSNTKQTNQNRYLRAHMIGTASNLCHTKYFEVYFLNFFIRYPVWKEQDTLFFLRFSLETMDAPIQKADTRKESSSRGCIIRKSDGYRYSADLLVTHMNPVIIEKRGTIWPGFGISLFLRVFTAQDREITIFDTIPRYLIGRDRDIDIFKKQFRWDRDTAICTGLVWTGAGFQFYFTDQGSVPRESRGKNREDYPEKIAHIIHQGIRGPYLRPDEIRTMKRDHSSINGGGGWQLLMTW